MLALAYLPTHRDDNAGKVMGKLLWLLIGLPLLLAAETLHQHDYTGSHGMVLFAANDSLLVSHLPLYRPPHDYQLVYQVLLDTVTHNMVLAELNKHHLLTVLPADFDLRLMLDAITFTVTADFYQGHFERGGERWLTDVPLTFHRQLYQRRLPELQQPAANGHYAAFKLNGQLFLIHQIGAAPSYDHIVKVSALPAQLALATNSAQQALSLLQQQGLQVRQVYLETQDFTP